MVEREKKAPTIFCHYFLIRESFGEGSRGKSTAAVIPVDEPASFNNCTSVCVCVCVCSKASGLGSLPSSGKNLMHDEWSQIK